MTGTDRLLERFESGRFVRPSAERPSFADLAAAIVSLGGGSAPRTAGAEEFERLIGKDAEHIVLVLADGLGARLLERLPQESFLRRHVKAQYRTVFPSTTAVALTTLHTCRWPAEHSIPGWWLYLDAFGLSAVSLPFKERWSERPLEEFGVRGEDVFITPSAWGSMRCDAVTVICAGITDSVYTRYGSGGTPRIGYNGIGEAFDAALRRVRETSGPALTYVYLPQVDSLCHDEGTQHPEVLRVMEVIDAKVAWLHEEARGKARIVLTADHGLVDTPLENRIILSEGDEILSHLVVPPTGEPTVAIFHVREGHEEAFRKTFEGALGRHFVLVTPDEAEEMKLFGPTKLSPVMRRRLGAFIGIAVERAAAYYKPADAQAKTHAAVHAGLTAEEMMVPLVVA